MTLIGLRISGALSAFLVSLLMARYMETAEMGRGMVLMSTAVLSGIFVSLGIEAGAVRFVATYRKDDRPDFARGFFRFSWQLVGIVGLSICICATIFLWLRAEILERPFDIALFIALATACVTGVLRVGAAKAMAFGKVIHSLAPATFIRQMFLLMALMFYIWGVGQPTALTVIFVFLFGNVLAAGIQYLWNRRIAEGLVGEGRDVSEWPKWVRYGLALAPTLLFVQYSRDLTLIFSSWTVSAEDIAVLGIATALVNFAKFGVASINMSVAPTMADLIVRDDSSALRRLIDVSNHMKMWPSLGCFCLLAIFGSDLLGIFGDQFREYADILMILMLEPLALAFFGPSGQYLALAGQQRALMYAAIAALFVMMIAVSSSGAAFGLRGAAWAVAMCWIFWSAGLAYLARRGGGLGITFADTMIDLVRGVPK
ncbi:lipopolysaccharide biosynthesis protein [Roseovarius sp. M141]|uniref:lipopolysaccharide biosynthesis protein n=1 Tax=Roseovarius sp. M141 TaxID=2583806 RepID=UPI0020CD892D|nr:hypothetical protein [Roseovarius sp. M141]